MNKFKWEKLGRVLLPDKSNCWLHHWVSASCAISTDYIDTIRVYSTGKDSLSRSRIGTFLLNLNTVSVYNIAAEPVVELGERGTFDENGTGYPMVIFDNNQYYMYYLGWIKGVHVPWYNGMFLAKSVDGLTFSKVSKAPIFDRNYFDYLGVGSMYVRKEDSLFRMWYSRFDTWNDEIHFHKHCYNIRSANSKDGITWLPLDNICIDFMDKSTEYAIARPTVIKIDNYYYMWYCYRGESYRIGFALSKDGIDWVRYDNLVGIEYSNSGWDSEMLCYPFVFAYDGMLYMLYNGNEYGATGLGLACCRISNLQKVLMSYNII